MSETQCSSDPRATVIYIDRNQPRVHLLPTNNDRTGYQPFSYPIIITCPRAVTNGAINQYGPITQFKISIYGTNSAMTLGPDPKYVPTYPQVELSLELTELITNNLINIQNGKLCTDGTTEFFEFNARSGHLVRVEYYEDVLVYDISNFLIPIANLANGHYLIYYTATFNQRLITQGTLNEFYCISPDTYGKSELILNMNHPGDLLSFFQRGTPALYFTSANPASDPLLKLYRPFTDILQDIYDEQKLIPQVNFVYNSTNETFPYLSYILGWAAPYFPSNDTQGIRKALLRRTVELQGLRGSQNAITSLFNLLGYDVKFQKLWCTPDGKQFIAPNDVYNGQVYVSSSSVGYTDILLNDWCPQNTLLNSAIIPIGQNGYYNFTTPLRKLIDYDPFDVAIPTYKGVTIQVIGVLADSEAYNYLKGLAQDVINEIPPNKYTTAYVRDNNDQVIIEPGIIDPRIDCLATNPWFENKEGFISQTYGNIIDSPIPVLITNGVESQNIVSNGTPVVLCQPYITAQGQEFGQSNGLSLSLENNEVTIKINVPLDNGSNTNYTIKNLRLFAFASYWTSDIVINEQTVANLYSNRATIEIVDKTDGTAINPKTIDFALEYLQNVQSAHSIINLVRYRLDISESYLVSDMSIGGDYPQKHSTDFGKWQVPNGRQRILVPTDTGNSCIYHDPSDYGYTTLDLNYRKNLITNLLSELAAYRNYNQITGSGLYVITGDLNDGSYRPEFYPALLGNCPYSVRGQNLALEPRQDAIDHNDTFTNNTACGGYWERSAITNKIPTKAANNWDYNQAISPEPPLLNAINTDNSVFDTFDKQGTYVPETLCKIPTTDDYYYLGRATGDMFVSSTCISDEHIILNNGAVLGQGVYATYPIGTKTIRPGVLTPAVGSCSYYQINSTQLNIKSPGMSFLGNLIRSYTTTKEVYNQQTGKTSIVPTRPKELLFSTYFDPEKNFEDYIAYQKPRLNILNPILHLPGCRFPTLCNLKNDFVSSDYVTRSWDGSYCNPATPGTPYTIKGNGVYPDIDTLSNSAGVNVVINNIVHKIYSQVESRSYVTFDCITELGTEEVLSVDPVLFNSAELTNTDPQDAAPGNPSVRGLFSYLNVEPRHDWFEVLGVPTGGTGTSMTMAFYLSSGIIVDLGYRLDLNGGKVMDGAWTFSTPSGLYKDGVLDPGADSCAIISNLVSEEQYGVGSLRLDGYIPTLMEIL